MPCGATLKEDAKPPALFQEPRAHADGDKRKTPELHGTLQVGPVRWSYRFASTTHTPNRSVGYWPISRMVPGVSTRIPHPAPRREWSRCFPANVAAEKGRARCTERAVPRRCRCATEPAGVPRAGNATHTRVRCETEILEHMQNGAQGRKPNTQPQRQTATSGATVCLWSRLGSLEVTLSQMRTSLDTCCVAGREAGPPRAIRGISSSAGSRAIGDHMCGPCEPRASKRSEHSNRNRLASPTGVPSPKDALLSMSGRRASHHIRCERRTRKEATKLDIHCCVVEDAGPCPGSLRQLPHSGHCGRLRTPGGHGLQ